MHIAETDDEIMACLPVLKELRPHINEGEFLNTLRQMQDEGYVLACEKQNNEVVSVAGYYLCTNLSVDGKALYVYDLVTTETKRSEGHGDRLITDLKEIARNDNCVVIHLDSGVQRFGAHRFYLNHGFDIVSHHFTCQL